VPPFRDHANEIMIRTLDVDGSNFMDLIRIIHRDVAAAVGYPRPEEARICGMAATITPPSSRLSIPAVLHCPP
jgi:hypothetical protein